MKYDRAIIGTMTVIISAAALLFGSPAKADLRKEVAQRFQVEEGFLRP